MIRLVLSGRLEGLQKGGGFCIVLIVVLDAVLESEGQLS